jgi:transcriptional regulator with XRE-family HTH domain
LYHCFSAKSVGARLGARLRTRREALGLRQAKLAGNVDISANYVGVLERA